LYLSGNSFFSGTLPKEVSSLKQLKVLDTSRCIRLGGTIPPEVGSLKSLVTLNLSECNWLGSIPTELAQLASLEELNMGKNHQMSGSLPENIGDLHSIKVGIPKFLHSTREAMMLIDERFVSPCGNS